MKKIININLSARLIPIEDTAYDMLQLYVESLKKYFDKEVGKDEIISDIESRIAELFQDRLTAGAHCITDEDVTIIITSIGRPEELDAEENSGSYYYNEGAQTDSTASATEGSHQEGARKAENQKEGDNFSKDTAQKNNPYADKLYRNSNDTVIMGVCSGIAHKLKLDPTLVRILYVLLTLGSAGLALILYVLLSVFIPAAPLESNLNKRLFRNAENKMIAGLCSGLAAYFKVDVWVVRLIFSFTLLLQVAFAFIDGGGRIFGVLLQTFIFGSFTISFAVAYIVLWILIPVATTRSEKLQMQGKKVDLENIKNTVNQELSTPKEESGNRLTYFGSSFFMAIGKILKTLFVLVFALTVAALVVMFVCLIGLNWATGPYQSYFLTQPSDAYLLWGSLLLLFGISVLAMVLWVIRILTGRKKHPTFVSYSFALLWVAGLVCTVIFLTSIARGYRTKVNVETILPLTQPPSSKLIISVVASHNNQTVQLASDTNVNEQHEYGYSTDSNGRKVKVYGSLPESYTKRVKVYNSLFNNSDFQLNEASLRYKALKFHITPSKDSLYHLIRNNSSRGENSTAAATLANAIEAEVIQSDSIIYLPGTITLKKGEQFRMQHIIYNLQVPLGGRVFIDKAVSKSLLDDSDVFWDEDDFPFSRDWEHYEGNYRRVYMRWRSNIEYIMTENGLKAVR